MPTPSSIRARFFLAAFNRVTRWRRGLDRRMEVAANALVDRHLRAAHGGRLGYKSFRWLPAEDGARWARVDASPHRLTIVIVTYRQAEALASLLASLRCQTLQNFDLLVYHDGPDSETRATLEAHRSHWPGRCDYIESETRFNDYGHSLRDLGIKRAEGEFVLVTNGDNYYSPRCVEFAFDAVDAHRLDMVTWDLVHSHRNPGLTRNPCNSPFHSYPLRFYMDVGAFMVRSELARRIGFPDRTHDGDATYLELLLKAADAPFAIGKVEKTLMVHN